MIWKTCLLCGREHPRERCTTFAITPEDEALLIKRGESVPEEFVYCNKCWSIIKDPEAGPRFMRDTTERQMLRLGVPAAKAREMAVRYHTQLVELQRQRHHKVH